MLGKLATLAKTAPLPFYPGIEISRNGECLKNGRLCAKEDLCLTIENELLVLIAFQHFNMPPVYWKHLKVLRELDTFTPESAIIGMNGPIESLEYPGYYIIPYYSNYVISQSGILIKKSTGEYIEASKADTKYYTFRMVDDSNKTANMLRHRILMLAFKPYTIDVNRLDVNHLNGVRGDDFLDNLEWATRSRNMDHAYAMGLRSDNKPVQIRDVFTKTVYIFRSYEEAGEWVGVTGTTISNRIKSGAENVYNGMQYQSFPSANSWPDVNQDSIGKYIVRMSDGTLVRCNGSEAARLLGVTRTSFLRLIREGRVIGKTDNVIHEVTQSPIRE